MIEFTCEAIWSWTFVCWKIFFFFYKLFYFIYLFLAVFGLRCCAWAFSSCGEWGLVFILVRGLLIAVASCCGARALGAGASVVVAHGLSCFMACGIFPDRGTNPCPPALADGFLTTVPPGKPCSKIFNHSFNFITCDWSVHIFYFFLVQSWKFIPF